MEAEILQRLSHEAFNFKVICWAYETLENDLIFFLQKPDCDEYLENRVNHFNEGIYWLAEKACELYPESEFAKWWEEKKNHAA